MKEEEKYEDEKEEKKEEREEDKEYEEQFKNISLSTDALVPIHVLNFASKRAKSMSTKLNEQDHVLLKRLVLKSKHKNTTHHRKGDEDAPQKTGFQNANNSFIGVKAHHLPYKTMPVSMEIYNSNHFEIWLSHQENMFNTTWFHLNASRAVYELNSTWLERRSHTRMNSNLTLTSTAHR